MHVILFAVLLSAVLLPGAPAAAQSERSVELRPGFTTLLRFDRAVSTVVIGNPLVADAIARTDRAILVTGRAVGTTNLIVLNGEGAEIYSALVIVATGRADPGDVRIHSTKQLHAHYSYYCTPECVMVGEVKPPQVRPPAHERTVAPSPREEREEEQAAPAAPPAATPQGASPSQ
jgi:hypothetical protein